MADTSDVMTGINVSNDIAESFTDVYRSKITDLNWKNVSWIPTKIGKALPYAGMAVEFATADDGERLAAASAAGIGDVLSTSAAIAGFMMGGPPGAALLGITATIIYDSYFQSKVKDLLVQSQNNMDDYFTQTNDNITFHAQNSSVDFRLEVNSSGQLTKEISTGQYTIKILQEETQNKGMQIQYSINGKGIGYNEAGDIYVFDTTDGYFESTSSGQALTARMNQVIGEVQGIATSVLNSEYQGTFEMPATEQINPGVWKIESPDFEMFQTQDNVRISKGIAGTSISFGNQLDIFVSSPDSFILTKSAGYGVPTMVVEYSGGIYTMRGALSDVPVVSFTDPSSLPMPVRAVFNGLMHQFQENLQAAIDEAHKGSPALESELVTGVPSEVMALLQGTLDVISQNPEETYSVQYISVEETKTYELHAPFLVQLDGMSEDNLLTIIKTGTDNARMLAFQKLYELAEQNGVVTVLANGHVLLTLDGGTTFEKYTDLVSKSNGAMPQHVVISRNPGGSVLGAITENTLDVGVAQIVRELVQGSDGNGLIQLTNVNSELQTAIDSSISQIHWPENFLFQHTGGYFGALLGEQLAENNAYREVMYSTLLKTIGEHFGTFADLIAADNGVGLAKYFTVNGVDWKILEDLPELTESFFKNLNLKVSSVLGGIIGDEIADVLGTGGVIGEVTSTVTGTVSVEVIGSGLDIAFGNLDGTQFVNLLENGFDFDKVIKIGGVETTVADYIELNVYSALASYAGSRLAGEIISPESMQAAIFGSVGSAVGIAITTGTGFLGSTAISAALSTAFASAGSFVPVIGTAIGAFIGQVAGTLLGNLFGSQDEPFASAHIGFDRDTAQYSIMTTHAEDGGDGTVAHSMAAAAMNGVNAIIEMTHGTMRRGSNSNVEIGYDGDKMFVNANGKYAEFERSGDAIKFAALQLLESADIVGGHAILMRAWHNSEATTLEQFQQDLFVAEVFQTYLINPTGVLALMLNEPDSEAAQQWAAILQRAAELELHLPNERDIDGGWGEVLAARGDINPESIPDIQGDSLVLHDSITGEEIVLEHVIGPGYEIVRIPGTDGNDVIQINVDGPSIAYVTTGPGDDHFIGHDGADIFIGGSGDDTAQGGNGNDWLIGNEGNDALYGEAGDDLLVGGDGNDLLVGAQGVDTIYGGSGDDIIDGGEEANYLYGGTGNDTIMANNSLMDEVYGGAGDDIIYGTLYDHLYGEAGNDTFYVNGAAAYIRRGDGHDTIYLSHDYYDQIVIDKSIGANEILLSKEGADLILNIAGEDQSITIKDIYNAYNESTAHPVVLTVLGSIGSQVGYVHYSLTPNTNTAAPYPTYAIGHLSDPDGGLGTFIDGVQQTNVTLTDYLNATSNVPYIVMGSDAPSSIYDLSQPGPLSHSYFYGAGGNDYLWLGGSGFGLGSGGTGDDTIIAGMDNDELYGGAGNDSISGISGDDYIDGGSGNDELYGDYVDNISHIGNDTIYGREGNDTIHGNLGDDFIHGNEGADILFGDGGKDIIIGDEGDDEIKGGDGEDKLYGGSGNDVLFGDSDVDYLKGGAGDDILYGGSGADNLWGDSGNDEFVFTPADGSGADKILDFEVGIDKIIYRDTEVTQIEGVEAGVLITFLSGGSVLLDGVSLNNFDVNNDIVEGPPVLNEVHGTAGNDYIYGGSGRDVMYAYAGIDNILGGDGDDVLYGQEGDDGLYGEGGADYIHGGSGNDAYVYQTPGSAEGDTIEDDGSSSSDLLLFQNIDSSFTFPVLRLESGNSTDLLVESAWGTVTVKNQFAQDGEDRIETLQTYRSGVSTYLYLTSSALTFMGDDRNEILTMPSYGIAMAGSKIYGEGGNDVITGSSYEETLYGGAGDDTLNGGAGNDTLTGGMGSDTLDYTSADSAVNVNLATAVVSGGGGADIISGFENISGSAYADSLTGDTGNNILEGRAGDDSLIGEAGDDSYVYKAGYGYETILDTSGNDTIILGEGYQRSDVAARIVGNDFIISLKGTDAIKVSNYVLGSVVENLKFNDGTVMALANVLSINGTSGNDNLTGTTANDVMYGLEGNDTLNGGAGNDTIDGGAGIDTAVLNGLVESYAFTNNTTYIRIQDNVGTDGTDDLYGVEYVQFSNGLTLELASVSGWIYGTGSNDSIPGVNDENVKDVIIGLGGDDQILAYKGNDTLIGGAGNDTLRGDDGIDTEYGGLGNDTLYGNRGNDILYGEDGNDSLYGEDDDDTIYGGIGVDLIRGDGGNDIIYAGQGDDINVYGDDGADIIHGNEGKDTLKGNEGRDTLYGDEDDDKLYGREDADILYGGIGSDQLYGDGADSDTYVSDDVLYGEDGVDLLKGGYGNDILYGGAGNDAGTGGLFGGEGDDTLDGGDGDDTLRGESGNDIYVLSKGADNIQDDGGTADVLKLTNGKTLEDITFSADPTNSSNLLITITGETSSTKISGQNSVGNAKIEFIELEDGFRFDFKKFTNWNRGSAANDDKNGTSGDDIIIGFGGDDELLGAAGNDFLLTGSGADTLVGGDGNDELYSGDGNDTLYGGTGDDKLYGSLGDDTYFFTSGTDLLEDTGGTDTINMADGISIEDVTFTINNNNLVIGLTGVAVGAIVLTNQMLGGSSAIETLHFEDGTNFNLGSFSTWLRGIPDGTAASDFMLGTALAETLDGATGDDIIYGMAGNDNLYGGAGSDTLYGGSGNDKIYAYSDSGSDTSNDTAFGGDGDDDLYGSNGSDIFYGGAGIDVLKGGLGNDNLYGDAGDDEIRGDDGNDQLFGGDGVDKLIAGIGDDTIYGGYDDDSVYAGDGIDTIYGESGKDTLRGENGNDYINGGAGDDVIYGGNSTSGSAVDGDDTIIAGSGNDTIYAGGGDDIINGGNGLDYFYGGYGSDTFRFTAELLEDSKIDDLDRIKDWGTGAANDKITIEGILIGYDPVTSAISDFVHSTSNGSTTISVDRDGAGTQYQFVDMILIEGKNLTIATLMTNNQLEVI
ncbi:MAG: type I secretion C-terminal target domain-containing protein [Pseudobdellovibrionaceae bacterium]